MSPARSRRCESASTLMTSAPFSSGAFIRETEDETSSRCHSNSETGNHTPGMYSYCSRQSFLCMTVCFSSFRADLGVGAPSWMLATSDAEKGCDLLHVGERHQRQVCHGCLLLLRLTLVRPTSLIEIKAFLQDLGCTPVEAMSATAYENDCCFRCRMLQESVARAMLVQCSPCRIRAEHGCVGTICF